MKLTLLSSAFALLALPALSQHNYMISSPEAKATYIRDAAIVSDQTLLCALDLKMDKPEAAIAQFNESGEPDWARRIQIKESQKVFGYDVLAHPNGSYYVHGLTLVDFEQYAFVLRLDQTGRLLNRTFFYLGASDFHAINKMKKAENGDLVFSFSHYDGVSFARLNPDGTIKWGKTIGREIYGTGKQPGYDFQLLEDESIIATGKNGYHFGMIKLSKNGQIEWDHNVLMGQFSEAKTIKELPDGNVFITGDYLRSGHYATFVMLLDGSKGSPIWAKELDQFDGSFHYQQTELVQGEIHLSMMGNNNPNMDDPEFQNYYVRLGFDGEVIKAYRNGEKYDMADYQGLLRSNEGSIIFGSAYDDQRNAAGLIHAYKSHDFDVCYWTALDVSTSPVEEKAEQSYGAYFVEDLQHTDALDMSLVDIKFESEGTCRQVWDESTEMEDLNSVTADEPGQERSIMESHEFTVFPNPNDGIFSIRTSFNTVDAVILDSQGKIIFRDVMENGDKIDLSTHPTGIYIMQITTETETMIRRISIK